jgi:hypothetical protein
VKLLGQSPACFAQIDLQLLRSLFGGLNFPPVTESCGRTGRSTGTRQEGCSMKTLVTSLGILALAGLMAGCGPDMNAINQATQRAESDAQRASAAATSAEAASAQAQEAAKKADEEAAGAQEAVSRANDAVARLEAAFSSSVTK